MPTLLEYLNDCEKVINTWPEWKRRSVREAFGLMTREESPYESVTVTSADASGSVSLDVVLKAVPYSVPMTAKYFPSLQDLELFKVDFKRMEEYDLLSRVKGASDNEIFFYDRADGFFVPSVAEAFSAWVEFRKGL